MLGNQQRKLLNVFLFVSEITHSLIIIITIIYAIVSFKIEFWILNNHHHFTSSLIAVESHKVMQCIALWEGPCHGHYLFCSIVEGTIQRTNLHTQNWKSQIKWQ